MITRPSTSRVLEDVVEELTRDIMPMITDPAQQIRLHMLMIVLNDCVNASEREISVMRSEIAEYLAFAGDVAKVTGNDVAAAVAGAQMGDSLVLSDVIREYGERQPRVLDRHGPRHGFHQSRFHRAW